MVAVVVCHPAAFVRRDGQSDDEMVSTTGLVHCVRYTISTGTSYRSSVSGFRHHLK